MRDLENAAREKENQVSSPSGAFGQKKAGLPSLSDDLPPLGGPAKSKPAVKFNDFDDDFSAGEEDEIDVNEANNDDEDEDEDQNGDFDANELLNLGDYQKKRLGMAGPLGRDKESPLPALAPIGLSAAPPKSQFPEVSKPKPAAQRSVLGAANAAADEAFDFSDEDEVESEEESKAVNIDFANFDYKKTDLNKLTDAELKAHKAAMELDFNKKVLRKGDDGFEYDKRVDFKYNADAAGDDSWDQSDDEEGVEIVVPRRGAQQSLPEVSRPAAAFGRNEDQMDEDFDGVGDNDDDYFDDDFV